MNMLMSIDTDTLLNMMWLSFVGAVAYTLRQLPSKLWQFVTTQFTIMVEISDKDPAYNLILRWLQSSGHVDNIRTLKLKSQNLGDGDQTEWVLKPGPGTYWIRRGLKSIQVKLASVEDSSNAHLPAKESIVLRMLGRNKKVLSDFVTCIYKGTQEPGVVTVYTWVGWWRRIMRKRMRPLATVVAKDGLVDEVLADLRRFLASSDWYTERGIPYRRGYIFCGPPGTGKTSLIQALAGELGKPLSLLNLGAMTGDQSLQEAVLSAPANAIIVMEDVDCAKATEKRVQEPDPVGPVVATTGKKDEDGGTGVTLSGLLNVLDGVATPDGRIFMLTTNHPENLDPALLRPGRADVRQTLGLVGVEETVKMARRFYGDDVHIPQGLPLAVSPAAVQEAFMLYPYDAEKSFEYLKRNNKQEGPYR